LVGLAMDRRRARKNPPAHLDDPEFAAMGDKLPRALLTTRLLVRLPLGKELMVKTTRAGFDFAAKDHPLVSYSGWFNKKKLTRFLNDHGVHPDAP